MVDRILYLPPRVVGRLWISYQETGECTRRQEQGRSRMTTPMQYRFLVLLSHRNHMGTASSSCVCLSDLEASRGEPGSRVLVQADNSFSARRRPVLWADIQYVVHCLLWGTTFTDRGVLEAPLQHGRAKAIGSDFSRATEVHLPD